MERAHLRSILRHTVFSVVLIYTPTLGHCDKWNITSWSPPALCIIPLYD